MRRRALLPALLPALLAGLPRLAGAVFRDEVGDIDFHYALVGVPRPETTLFHRPRAADKASLLYTLSDLGVLGAVNPSSGDLVWRQQLAAPDAADAGAGFLRAPDGEAWVAAARGSTVQAWQALTGRSLWQADFAGAVAGLETMQATETRRRDVLALSDEAGATVLRRIDGRRGSVVWEFRDTGGGVPLHVSNDMASVFVVSLDGADGAHNLRVTALDPATGARVDQWHVGAEGDIGSAGDVVSVGANSAAPMVAWASSDLARLTINVLGSRATQDLGLAPGAASVRIHAPHLAQSQTHFLVHVQTGDDGQGGKSNKAVVFHTDVKTGRAAMAYELPSFGGEGAFSTSCDGADVYFTQIGDDETLVVSSDSHGVLARWPHGHGVDARPWHAVAEVVKKAGGTDFAVRAAVVTESGDWTLVRNGGRDWTRPEGLSGGVAAVWAEMAEGEDLAKVLAHEAHTSPLSAYVHRVRRHVDDLRHLPGYLPGIPTRVVNSVAGGEVVGNKGGNKGGNKEGLDRDTFGFNKILVVVTRRGRLYGLDTGNGGRILWSQGWFARNAGRPLVVRGLVANDDGTVAMYGGGGEYAALNGSTGAAHAVRGADGEMAGVSSTAVVDDGAGRVLLPIGVDGVPTRDLPAGWDPERTVVVRGAGDRHRGEGDTLRGVRFRAEGARVARHDMWQLPMGPGERIAATATAPRDGAVASIGRVLGDRRVLYKYLNGNGIVVAAVDAAARTLSVRLVDGASGQVLAAQRHRGVDAGEPVSCAMAENWYACAFFGAYALDDATGRGVKGHQLVVSDLYESPEPNSRGALGDAANASAVAPVDDAAGLPLPWVESQAFVVSQPLAALAVTQTRQAIATRHLVAYLPRARGIAALSRHLVDPRRPVGRDPAPADVEAEGLARYAPALEIDARSVVSHERDVAAVAAVVAAPAVVESTCLLAAVGVDVFVTRVAPSGVFDILGRGFNKASLVATVLALLAGVVALGPVVRRKQMDRRWEAFL